MISLRNVLLLTPKEGFIFGCACIVGFVWFALIMVRRLPLLLRDLIVLARGCFASETPKVVNLDERRRQLNAAASGRRAS